MGHRFLYQPYAARRSGEISARGERGGCGSEHGGGAVGEGSGPPGGDSPVVSVVAILSRVTICHAPVELENVPIAYRDLGAQTFRNSGFSAGPTCRDSRG